ncbi:MAG: LysM peptidoglycan-binding domain-containing protein [Planctomycetes bacterium]|nr:LysM peptidoglycan-binding domain-containing protein [Planctomycetota bacterium]
MHRDKKVGLALAILLCSIVGAFFFRDDAPRNNGPELQDPNKLDQEIAHLNRRPYSDPDTRTRGNDPRRAAERSRSGFDPNDLPDFLRDNPSSSPGTAQRNRVNGSRDPLFGNDRNPMSSEFSTLTPSPQDAPAVPIPIHNTEWDVANKDQSTARRGGTDALTATSAKGRTHIVTDGETLSSIAGKYLGSQARYQEVFQANRDQLKSVNDLKIGMKLNIPDLTETRSTSGSIGSVHSSSRISPDQTVKTLRPTTKPSGKVTEQSNDAAESSDSTNRKPKFKPAKSGPSIRRTTDADETDSTGKTLSQLPPRDLSEIDDGILAELESDMETPVAAKPAATSVSRVAQATPMADAGSADSPND